MKLLQLEPMHQQATSSKNADFIFIFSFTLATCCLSDNFILFQNLAYSWTQLTKKVPSVDPQSLKL